jgi:hypothetical protein
VVGPWAKSGAAAPASNAQATAVRVKNDRTDVRLMCVSCDTLPGKKKEVQPRLPP